MIREGMPVRGSPIVGALLLTAFGIVWAEAAFAATAPPQNAQTAVWVRHVVNVRLRNLPRRYLCADLRARMQGILLEIGAREGATVLPRRCERVLGAAARSPTIHLVFELMQAGKNASASAPAVKTKQVTVRLEAGRPRSLDPNDCELLRQIKTTLLERLPIRVGNYSLACLMPEHARPKFGVTVHALVARDQGSALHSAAGGSR
jgi:hypothetical protein